MEKKTELLPAYLDNQLDAAAAGRVKSHVAMCPDCREEERMLAASWNLLGSLEAIEPSPDFRARFWEKVRREEEKSSRLSWPRLVPAFAGFLGVWAAGAGLGMYLFAQTPPAGSVQREPDSSLSAAYLKRLPTALAGRPLGTPASASGSAAGERPEDRS
jgi:anti-sigma factor RsiW